MKRHRPGGVAQIIGPHGVQEHDTFTCRHCQYVIDVKPMCDPAAMGGRCPGCDGLICPKCVELYRTHGCTPWEEQMRRMEAREAARRSYAECG